MKACCKNNSKTRVNDRVKINKINLVLCKFVIQMGIKVDEINVIEDGLEVNGV